MRRILSVVCAFALMGGIPVASAVTERQLCGYATHLADSLMISGFEPDGGPFLMVTGWAQTVPTLYNLLGSGAFIRTPGDVNTFSGGITLTNNSTAFQNNPVCAGSPVVHVDNPSVPTFAGSVELRCVGGSAGPFTVTFEFTLVPCEDPGLFALRAAEDAAYSGLAVGLAPNEYRAPE